MVAIDSKKVVWALDFDGVVCNSVGESSETAWKVSKSVTLTLQQSASYSAI